MPATPYRLTSRQKTLNLNDILRRRLAVIKECTHRPMNRIRRLELYGMSRLSKKSEYALLYRNKYDILYLPTTKITTSL